ncbi:MAG: hypothetical protein JXR89_07370 [Deltaproteobacteria bacterium]|nr:hypothetical protein [Deltaproteobacteria bacterium]
MAPWEIWISESQERMTLAVPPEKWSELEALLRRRGVEATVIGEFTASGRCRVSFAGEMVMDMELDFLHNGLPRKQLLTRAWPQALAPAILPEALPLPELFIAMFGRLNLASHAYVTTQYDFEVQGGTVLKPLLGKNQIDAFTTVVQPLPHSEKGVALSQSLYPAVSELDTYAAAVMAIDTAVRNLLAVGTPLGHIALLDNFCWCSSDEPERLWQLKECARACYETAVAYGTPFISGKDSMYNDFRGFTEGGQAVSISVPPTILISSIGVLPDVARLRTFALVRPGDRLYLLGRSGKALGGSEYLALLRERGLVARGTSGLVPEFDPASALPLYKKLQAWLEAGRLRSLYPPAQGGLALAAGKGALAEGLGLVLEIPLAERPDLFLFNEYPGRFLVSLAPELSAALENDFVDCGCLALGEVLAESRILIRQGGKLCFATEIETLLTAYRSTFAGF